MFTDLGGIEGNKKNGVKEGVVVKPKEVRESNGRGEGMTRKGVGEKNGSKVWQQCLEIPK